MGRRSFARFARIAAIAAAATLFLVAATAAFLLSPAGKRFVLRSIERAATADGETEIAIDAIELEPWSLSGRLDGVRLRRGRAAASAETGGVGGPDTGGAAEGGDEIAFDLEAAGARASLGGRGRLQLVLESPRLAIQIADEDREPTPGAPSIGERLERARLGRLRVEDGTLRLLDREGREVVRLENVALDLDREASRRFAATGRAGVHLRAAAGRWLDAGTLEVEGGIAGPEIELARAHLEREGADLTARGTLLQRPEAGGALEADFRLGAAVVREVFPDLRATGELDGTARLELAPDGLRVEADFRGAGLYWDRLGPFAAGGRLRLADRRLNLSRGSLAGYGGSAELAAGWDLDEDRQRLDVAWTGIDAVALAADLGAPELPPATARSSGEASLETSSFALDRTSGPAAVRLEGRSTRTGAPLEAAAQGRLEGGALALEESRVRLGAGTLDARGRLGADGSLDADYRLRIADLGRLGPITGALGLPAPPVELRGELEAVGVVTGTVRDPQWTAAAERQRVAVAGEAVDLALDAGGDRRSAEIHTVAAGAAGGTLRLQGGLAWGDSPSLSLRLEIAGVDLCALESIERAPACGVLQASGTVSGPLDDPRWRLAGEIAGLRSRPAGAASAVPTMPGLLRFRARREDRRVLVEELRGVLDGGALEAGGAYDLATRRLDAWLRATDLPLASLLPEPARAIELVGLVDAEGSFEGPLDGLAGDAVLNLHELAYDGRPLPDTSARVVANGAGELEVEAGASGGEPFLTGRVELGPPYQVQADLLLGALPPSVVVTLLHELPHRIEEPQLAGRVAIDAVLEEPLELHVRGVVEQLEARYGRLRLSALPFTVAGDREGLRVEELRLRSDGLELLVAGTVPFGGSRDLELRASGELPLELLATPELQLAGTADLDVRVGGRLRQPQVSGEARVEGAAGRFRDIQWQDVSLEARLAERQVFLEAAAGRVLGGSFTARGGLAIETPLSQSDVELAVDVEGIDLVRLAGELPARATHPYVRLDAEATLSAPRLDLAAATGWVDVLELRAGADGNEMSSLEPTRILVSSGRATLPQLHLVGGGTDLRIEGATSVARPVDDLEARVIGAVDFAQLGFLAASLPGLEFGGLGVVDLAVEHGAGGLELDGGGQIADGRIASLQPRFTITDITGDVAFRGSAIRLRELEGRLGGGTVEARASLDLAGMTTLESVVLEAEANGVNLSFGEGLRARFSGDALFQGRGDRYRLKGDLRILSGLFTREIDAATSEREFLAGIRAELVEDESAPFADTVELDVRLATAGDVFVDNELARVPAGGNLRVDGTLAEPELTGLITNTADGILRLGRNVFNLELARIALESYPLEPPYVEVAASTEVAGYSVRLELEGTPDDVDTTLTSTDPSLTQGDLAALLTTGRTAEGAPEGAATLLEARAATYLGELFQEQLGLGLVFDTPATLPILSSETGPEDRFTVGRRITDELTVAYSVGVEDDQSLWIIDFQPLRRLWFRAIEENGEAFTFELAQRLTLDPGKTARARPEPARIRSVELETVEGAAPLPPLERRLRIRPGQRYDYWRAEDAAEAVRRELADLGYLGAQVEVETAAPRPGEVAVRLVADPGPLVEFLWTGDDPGEDLREEIERQWGSRLPPGLLVADLAARAEDELRADRFYRARVFGSVAEHDAVRIVELEVRLGPRGEGVDLDFAGNDALSDEALARVLPATDDARFFTWIDQASGRLEDAIALRYAEEGFLDVTVGEIESRLDEATGRLAVTIPVREGERYVVASVAFPGASGISDVRLEEALPIAVGATFSLASYREAARELRRFYRHQGYPDASVRSRIRRLEPGAVELVWSVEEGSPAVIGAIEVSGNERTREATIRRRIGLESGQPLRVSELAAAERDLYRLGVFRSVEVVARDPLPGRIERDVVVRVVEKPSLSIDYGVRYRTDDVESLQPTVDEVKTKGLEAVVRTQLLQPFRRGDSMILSLFGGEERRRARLGYQTPRFFGTWIPTEVSVETGKETRQRFDIEVASRSSLLTVQQRRRLGESTRLLYGLQLQRGRIDSVRVEDDAPVELAGDWVDHNRLTTSLVHDLRDDLMDPRRGSVFSGTVQVGSPAIGADTTFLRANGQWSLFVPLGRGERAPVWASSYRSGAIWSSDPFVDPLLDLEDRFTAGGPFSVRGFEANTLGPRFPDEQGFPIGGRGVLIVNQELRFPIWDDLWGGVFYDAGNVFLRAEDIRLDQLRESFGLGLRYDIGFGVIRVDLARVRDRQAAEARERVHLSFGHAF